MRGGKEGKERRDEMRNIQKVRKREKMRGNKKRVEGKEVKRREERTGGETR